MKVLQMSVVVDSNDGMISTYTYRYVLKKASVRRLEHVISNG